MKKYLLIVILILSGCAEWYALKTAVGSYGAEAADEVADTALWTLCDAISVGASGRKFQTPESKVALATLCKEH